MFIRLNKCFFTTSMDVVPSIKYNASSLLILNRPYFRPIFISSRYVDSCLNARISLNLAWIGYTKIWDRHHWIQTSLFWCHCYFGFNFASIQTDLLFASFDRYFFLKIADSIGHGRKVKKLSCPTVSRPTVYFTIRIHNLYISLIFFLTVTMSPKRLIGISIFRVLERKTQL